MQQGNSFLRVSIAGFLIAGSLLAGGSGFAQTKTATMPDAQIEANVLKALAGAPQLADQAISTTTVYGTVTLSGTVRDEASRDMAEKLAANAAGVQKVVDELTIGGGAPAATGTSQPPEDQNPADVGTNPNLQSDGTMAPPAQGQPQQQSAPYPQGNQGYPQANQGQAGPPPAGQSPADGSQQAGQYPQNPPVYRQPYARPYPPPPPPPPGYAPYAPRPYVAQKGGDAVVVPTGATVRVRINQAMDSKKTVPGSAFDGVVLNDVIAGGFIAIPRGATVQGTVVDVHGAGQLAGKGVLSLKLTQMTLAGKTYPLVTDVWAQQGVDKTGQTVGNTVGLAGVGALIGAVAGGGVGAAVGAGIGGVTGLGISSASNQGQAVLPAEAILNFRLAQPTELTTVSQAELDKLGYGVPPPGAQPQMRRRYYPYPPPPPPGYYGPVYYPQ